jgi:hypothetical protein
MASARLSVRYVGYTVSANGRLADHIEEAKCGWILQVLMSGFVPVIRIVDQGLGHSWREAERFWIRFYREEVGADLTNLTDGGEGALGLKWSDEARARITGRTKSAEVRSKISLSLLGIEVPEERRKRISLSNKNKPKSAAHRKAISDGLKGNKNSLGHKHGRQTKQLISNSSSMRIRTANGRFS